MTDTHRILNYVVRQLSPARCSRSRLLLASIPEPRTRCEFFVSMPRLSTIKEPSGALTAGPRAVIKRASRCWHPWFGFSALPASLCLCNAALGMKVRSARGASPADSGARSACYVLYLWGRAPHARQANPVGGCPPQFAHRVVSCRGDMPKIAADRSTSWVVHPRCRPLRRPSAAHTVEFARLAHQLPELGLVPAMLLAQDPDIRADHGRLVRRYLIDAVEPSGHHAPACQMTLYDLNDPGWLTYPTAPTAGPTAKLSPPAKPASPPGCAPSSTPIKRRSATTPRSQGPKLSGHPAVPDTRPTRSSSSSRAPQPAPCHQTHRRLDRQSPQPRARAGEHHGGQLGDQHADPVIRWRRRH